MGSLVALGASILAPRDNRFDALDSLFVQVAAKLAGRTGSKPGPPRGAGPLALWHVVGFVAGAGAPQAEPTNLVRAGIGVRDVLQMRKK